MKKSQRQEDLEYYNYLKKEEENENLYISFENTFRNKISNLKYEISILELQEQQRKTEPNIQSYEEKSYLQRFSEAILHDELPSKRADLKKNENLLENSIKSRQSTKNELKRLKHNQLLVIKIYVVQFLIIALIILFALIL